MSGPPFSPRFEAYLQAQERMDDRRNGIFPEPPPRPVLPPENIYYIQQGDLIKIGYSTGLLGRLRSYGPALTVLAHHAGTRADERDLHLSFRPLLAYGREWYEPGQVLLDHIARMVELHGEPWCIPDWAKPKAKPAPQVKRHARLQKSQSI